MSQEIKKNPEVVIHSKWVPLRKTSIQTVTLHEDV